MILLQDCTIAVWDMKSPSDITLGRVLTGHAASVNAIDFDERYIISGSGDWTIKVGFAIMQQFYWHCKAIWEFSSLMHYKYYCNIETIIVQV